MDNTDDVDFDKYSALSEELLLLKGDVSTNLTPDAFEHLLYLLGFDRFLHSLIEKDPNSSAVRKWCKTAVAGTQIRREQLDHNMEAEITRRAVNERCSNVFKYDLDIKATFKELAGVGGGKEVEFEIPATTIKFYKYRVVTGDENRDSAVEKRGKKAHVAAKSAKKGRAAAKSAKKARAAAKSAKKARVAAKRGVVTWEPDPLFGKNGVEEIKIKKFRFKLTYDKRGKIKSDMDSVLNLLGSSEIMSARRKLRNIKEFQAHAPILSTKGGVARTCLGKDTVEQDLPFIVIFDGDGKEVQMGFVKARKIYDGCHMTPALKKQAKGGGKVDIKPMESQIILGGRNVKTGYTMWELPSIGLNFGGGLVFGQAMIGVGSGTFKMWPSMAVQAEFNLAPYSRISEFYVWGTLRVSAGMDQDFNNKMDGKLSAYGLSFNNSATFLMQFDAGVMKRWYSRFFVFGLGGGVNVSGYIPLKSLPNDYTANTTGIGLNGLMVLGFQLTPRFLLDFRFGYRFEVGLMDLARDNDSIGPTHYMGCYHGFMTSLNLLYNF